MLDESLLRHFWMKLREAPLETLQKREMMPGFKIMWKMEELEPKEWEVEVDRVGRKVENPGYMQPLEEGWWREKHT